MQLYFLRHGIAVEHGAPGYENNDDARPLTDEGVKVAKQVAKALKTLVKADVILTSPLPRARRTADIASEALEVDVIETDLLGLEFNRDRLAEALAQAQAGRDKPLKRVILVGHEPSMSQTIGALTGPGLRLVLKKTGLARVDVEANLSEGMLRWLLTPGQLERLAE
jgi:phosphohistidine phosphatase SixA